jgi:hypothetical protein
MPIIRSLSTAAAASGLPYERGGSSAFGPEAVTTVTEFLMMGGEKPEICGALNKRQDNKLVVHLLRAWV